MEKLVTITLEDMKVTHKPNLGAWEDAPLTDEDVAAWNLNKLSDFTLTGKIKSIEDAPITICVSDIEKVIFNFPATVVYFTDGDKVVVKITDDDEFQPEVGLAMAIVKKMFGSRGAYKKFIDHYLPKDEEDYEQKSNLNKAITNLFNQS